MNGIRIMAFACVIGMAVAASATRAEIDEYQAGQDATAEHRYAEALAHFQASASHGNRDAQRISGLMLLYGERLYGAEVRKDRVQALRWLKAAKAGGCEASSFILQQALANEL